MKSRVLYKDGCYIPQVRHMLSPFWYNISDEQFDQESENLDCYDTELTPSEVAEACARRAVGNKRDFIGCVNWLPLGSRLFKVFQGPVGPQGYAGMPGPQGPRGAKGDTGRDGFSRSALDLQCPNPKCGKFLSDYPEQQLKMNLYQDQRRFDHVCAACNHGAVWQIVEGLPVPLPLMTKESIDAISR